MIITYNSFPASFVPGFLSQFFLKGLNAWDLIIYQSRN